MTKHTALEMQSILRGWKLHRNNWAFLLRCVTRCVTRCVPLQLLCPCGLQCSPNICPCRCRVRQASCRQGSRRPSPHIHLYSGTSACSKQHLYAVSRYAPPINPYSLHWIGMPGCSLNSFCRCLSYNLYFEMCFLFSFVILIDHVIFISTPC